MRGLNGKTAIVTGGGGAIGRAIGRRLAEEGAIVGLIDIDVGKAENVAREIGDAGGRAYAHAADIADYGAVKAAVAALYG